MAEESLLRSATLSFCLARSIPRWKRRGFLMSHSKGNHADWLSLLGMPNPLRLVSHLYPVLILPPGSMDLAETTVNLPKCSPPRGITN